MWRAWVNRSDGSIARIFVEHEPTPEYSEATHDLIVLDDAQLADAKAGKQWDAGAKQLVDAPPEIAKSAQELAAEVAQTKRAAAEAWIARMPAGVIEVLADRVAQLLKKNP